MNYRMSPGVASTDSLPHLLDALVKEEPNAPMLIDAATDRRVTRAQFDQENRAWARRLAAGTQSMGSAEINPIPNRFQSAHQGRQPRPRSGSAAAASGAASVTCECGR
jgi:hypothetical protein